MHVFEQKNLPFSSTEIRKKIQYHPKIATEPQTNVWYWLFGNTVVCLKVFMLLLLLLNTIFIFVCWKLYICGADFLFVSLFSEMIAFFKKSLVGFLHKGVRGIVCIYTICLHKFIPKWRIFKMPPKLTSIECSKRFLVSQNNSHYG